VDLHVGSRVRLRRKMLGLSQEQVAKRVGLTFQGVQKYERGRNRISASRLLEFAQILGVSVGFFFDDVDPVRAVPIVVDLDPEVDQLERPETIELVAAYYAIDETIRRRLFNLAQALAKRSDDRSEDVSSSGRSGRDADRSR
jgi:transcriptional regulator with XRE-family HTH domain